MCKLYFLHVWITFTLFHRYMRMSLDPFKYLLNVVGPIISKEDTRFLKAITSAERILLNIALSGIWW